MKIQQNKVVTPTNDFEQIKELWSLFLPRWGWFLLSLVACLGAAVLYLAITPKQYTRYAELLVKDDKKNASGATAISNEFNELGIFSSQSNINNELTTLKSPEMMTEVVQRLRLNENFSMRDGMKIVTLYGRQPVNVYFKGKASTSFKMKIQLTSHETFIITDFSSDDIDGMTFQGKLGEGIKTPVGTIALSRSNYFNNSMIGETFSYSHGDVDSFADSYAKRLLVDLSDKKGTVINLSIVDESPKRAEDLLNTLIEVYNENWVKDRNRISISTSKFISERLGVIAGELGNVDANISSFKSANLLPDVEAASQMYLQQSADNNKELMGLSSQLANAQFIRQELSGKDLSQPLPTNSGISESSIESRISMYNSSVLDRNRLLASSSEKNPLVEDLTQSLKQMKQSIIQSVDNYIVSLRTQMGSVNRSEAIATGKLASNPNQAKYLLSVERQQKVKEELYLYLLQKREENELSQAFTSYNTRVITAPRGSKVPTAPKSMNILLMAFAVGLLLPAAIIIARENMNTVVRGRKDLENLTAPLIGEIPQHFTKKRKWLFGRRKKLDENAILVKEGSRSVINEAFRVLRSNIEFMVAAQKENNVFVFTSFNPGSGKSFIAMNIAMSYAIKKKRVLVIDGDFRHGSTSQFVDSPEHGITDFLSGMINDWKNLVVHHQKNDNLHVLPVGKMPPNPTELLENGKMEKLIEQVRATYDYIFIDCPPIDIVADAQILEKLADRTIFIVRAGLLERNMLPLLESIYKEKRFKNLSLVLNGTESTNGRYGYRYGYHYGSASYYDSKGDEE